ncbi:hypothetical protein CCACVL1_07304 [Corchorus capsularis]|uniref:Protein XRI1 n=1 Tax=Corchorus capsularis TaxID=210143 RepID=A0A1R3J7B0_COCAP|nr:hypothetical protein CCACVL1_07304 [Corchorus capsularis]
MPPIGFLSPDCGERSQVRDLAYAAASVGRLTHHNQVRDAGRIQISQDQALDTGWDTKKNRIKNLMFEEFESDDLIIDNEDETSGASISQNHVKVNVTQSQLQQMARVREEVATQLWEDYQHAGKKTTALLNFSPNGVSKNESRPPSIGLPMEEYESQGMGIIPDWCLCSSTTGNVGKQISSTTTSTLSIIIVAMYRCPVCSNLTGKAGEPWNWHGENYSVQKNSNFDAPQAVWTQVTLNEEDLSYMFDETTPVKECGDLSHHVTYNDNANNDPEDRRETSSQIKRRRMLQFDTNASDSSLICEEMPSAFLKSRERDNLIEEVLPDASQWIAGFSEDASASSYEGLDQSCEGWLAEYFNDAEMILSSDDMNVTGTSDVQMDISEVSNSQPELGADAIQKQATRTPRNVVIKGRQSFIRPPPKLASSVAYPFAFIKPCGFHGDVTLKDINQRIRTPPPSKSKQSNEELAADFPTSAFSGKPVVGKTKIRTEGGKGSITIMRTKG